MFDDRRSIVRLYVAANRSTRSPGLFTILAGFLLAGTTASAADVDSASEVNVPSGFRVSLFADDDLAHNIYSMTTDSRGNVVVAGAGYVKTLLDNNDDGLADEAKLFADGPKSGSQGMFFLGSDLLCTGDGGLLRYRDSDNDGKADGPPDTFLKFKTGGEHDVHTIQRGPDGWWYLNGGNYAGIDSTYATEKTSPIKEPQAGVIFRLKPDLSGGEIVAHGYRNSYDFAFHPQGDIFLFDSDGERDVSLPWYEPTRVFQAVPGSHAGWVSRSWKQPASFIDMPPVLGQFGRGSPTGVVCYRHNQFPKEYHDSLFVLDWTYGRVINLQLTRTGAAFTAKASSFMTAVGQHGFAPTDAVIGPDGSLYISVGGRGTRGGVYRVEYTDSGKDGDRSVPKLLNVDAVDICLDAPQPLSSWSRSRWEPLAKQLGEGPFLQVLLNTQRTTKQRVRAIEILVESYGKPDGAFLKSLSADPSAEVRARAAWAIGRTQPIDEIPKLLVPFVGDEDPFVGRVACEALLGLPGELKDAELAAALVRRLASSTRFDRIAAARLVPQLGKETFKTLAVQAAKLGWTASVSNAFGFLGRKPGVNDYVFELGLRVLERELPTSTKLEAVRLMQLGLGDLAAIGEVPAVFDGYSAALDLSAAERKLDPFRIRLAELYPTGDKQLDFEIARLLAMLEPYNPALLTKVLAQITESSHPTDDVHHLIVAARIPTSRDSEQREVIARALVQIEPKLKARSLNQDTNWDPRFKELYKALVQHDPLLPDALIEQPEFGRPDHVRYMSELPGELLDTAIACFERQVEADPDYPWTNDVLFVFGESKKPEHRVLIRNQFSNFTVRNAVLIILSESPEEADRTKFVFGIESSQVEVLEACLDALLGLPAPNESTAARENVELVRCLRRLNTDQNERAAREKVVKLLRRNTGQNFGFELSNADAPQTEAVKRWTRWAVNQFPQEASVLTAARSSDAATIQSLLARVQWDSGDADAGRALFEKRSCVQCHGSRKALGPDLAGAAKRFSREDLFTAIVDPSRDVSSRYQTTMLQTTEGKAYTGLIIYESIDGVILRNGTNQTFRIETEDVELRRKLPQSLMPAGLLKDATAADLANLYAYLKSLGAQN